MPCSCEHDVDVTYNHDGISRRMIAGGEVAHEQFEALIEISSIHSHKIIPALYDHLVKGVPRKEVCEKHGVTLVI